MTDHIFLKAPPKWKKYFKKIIQYFLSRENIQIKKLIKFLLVSKFKLLDIGAAGGEHNRWHIASDNINIVYVEPHDDNSKDLINKNKNSDVITKILSNEPNQTKTLYYARKKQNSSLFKPNFEHLNKYPEPERFEIISETKLITSTIDAEFRKADSLDFVKIDAEGSELDILKGSVESFKFILGFEVECEFFKLRENQPLFNDIKIFLEKYDYEFIDFLNILRWRRNEYNHTGQPQISDILLLKKPEIIINNFKDNIITEEKLLKYIVILIIYNRIDIFWYINKNLDLDFKKKYNLEKLFNLSQKKITRLNYIKKVSKLLENVINDCI